MRCEEERVTYKELFENVNRFANVLSELNVAPTERVLIVLPDSPTWLYAFLGSIKYGAWPVPVNTMLNEEDYQYMLEDSEARVLVTGKDHKAARAKSAGFRYKLFSDNGLQSFMNAASPGAVAIRQTQRILRSGSIAREAPEGRRVRPPAHRYDPFG